MYITKQEKYEFLVKKLFIQLAKITLGNKYNQIKLEISYNRWDLINHFYHHEKKIILKYYSIKYRIKEGYKNSYYKNRYKKINKIIHNNRHNFIRFVLLHELKHASQLLENKTNISSLEFQKLKAQELEADDYAIKTLQKVI